jgi:hypothetical protein
MATSASPKSCRQPPVTNYGAVGLVPSANLHNGTTHEVGQLLVASQPLVQLETHLGARFCASVPRDARGAASDDFRSLGEVLANVQSLCRETKRARQWLVARGGSRGRPGCCMCRLTRVASGGRPEGRRARDLTGSPQREAGAEDRNRGSVGASMRGRRRGARQREANEVQPGSTGFSDSPCSRNNWAGHGPPSRPP